MGDIISWKVPPYSGWLLCALEVTRLLHYPGTGLGETHARTHTHTHTHACTYTRTHLRTHAHTHTHTHALMYARTHTHTHTHTRTYTRTRTHTCTHTCTPHTCMHLHTHALAYTQNARTYTRTRTHTYVHTHARTLTRARAHTHVHTHMHAHTHTHTHTHLHTHTHARANIALTHTHTRAHMHMHMHTHTLQKFLYNYLEGCGLCTGIRLSSNSQLTDSLPSLMVARATEIARLLSKMLSSDWSLSTYVQPIALQYFPILQKYVSALGVSIHQLNPPCDVMQGEEKKWELCTALFLAY